MVHMLFQQRHWSENELRHFHFFNFMTSRITKGAQVSGISLRRRVVLTAPSTMSLFKTAKTMAAKRILIFSILSMAFTPGLAKATDPWALVPAAQAIFSEIAARADIERSLNAYSTAFYLNSAMERILRSSGEGRSVLRLEALARTPLKFYPDHGETETVDDLHLGPDLLFGAPLTDEGRKRILDAYVLLFEIEVVHFANQFTTPLKPGDDALFQIWEEELLTYSGLIDIFQTLIGEYYKATVLEKEPAPKGFEDFMGALDRLIERSESTTRRYAAYVLVSMAYSLKTAEVKITNRREGSETKSIGMPFPDFLTAIILKYSTDQDPWIAKMFRSIKNAANLTGEEVARLIEKDKSCAAAMGDGKKKKN